MRTDAIAHAIKTKLGGLDAKAQGLGGFDVNVHDVYDLIARVLYLGDGTTRELVRRDPHLSPRNTGCRSSSLIIVSSQLVDLVLLANFAGLQELSLECPPTDVPYAALVSLRTCGLSSPMNLGRLADAPMLEPLVQHR